MPCCWIEAASSFSSPRSRRTLAGSRSIRSRLISWTSMVVVVASVMLVLSLRPGLLPGSCRACCPLFRASSRLRGRRCACHVQLVVGQVHLPQLLGGVVGPPHQDGLVAEPEHAGPGLRERTRRDHRGRASVGHQRRGHLPGLARAEQHDVAVHGDDVVLVGAAAVVRIPVAQPRDHLVGASVALERDRVGVAKDLDVICGDAHVPCLSPGLLPGLLVAPLTTDRLAPLFAVNGSPVYASASLIQYRTPATVRSKVSPWEMRVSSAARNESWLATWRGHESSFSCRNSSQSWPGGSAHESTSSACSSSSRISHRLASSWSW